MNGDASRRAIFLDRDGVLIRSDLVAGKPFAITDPGAVHILPGVHDACAELSAAGFLLVMVTNQPDVARGKVSRQFVENTNAHLKTELGLNATKTCFHDDSDKCDCRKPLPGLLTSAALQLSIDLPSSIMVGDRWRDIEAGNSAGCRTVFIDCNYDEKMPFVPDHVAASLPDAMVWLRTQI